MMSKKFLSLVLLIMCVGTLKLSYAVPRLPSENRECATCHIMWLKDFKRKNIETLIPYDPKPVVKTGKQDVASTDDMCFSCHDGFVLESRSLWEPGKHAHPVGQKPSDKITIPIEEGKNIFPMNDDGRMYCGTCHTAHGVDWDDKDSTLFMRVRDVDGELCMACHKDKTKGAKSGSHPVLKKVHHKPDGLVKAGAKFGLKIEVVCQSCHKPHAAPGKKLLRVENKNSELCGECHDDRYAQTMADAARMKTHPVNVHPNKAKIPNTLIKAGAKQGEDGEVLCESCHRPHDAKSQQGLLVIKNKEGVLCQTCHLEKKSVLNSKHDMTLVDENSTNIRDQKVKEEGVCSACHVPHKGSAAKMWARPVNGVSAGNHDPMSSLCLSCHNKDGLADKHTVGTFSHPVGVDIERLGRKVALPTFGENGLKWQDVLKGKVSCASCHDPHQWDPDNIHNKAKPGDKGNNKTKFLRIANNSDAALCKTCHKEKWDIANSKHDMRLMAPDAENSLGQTADESGICGVCHLVHNAKGSKLWARDNLSGKGTGYVACLGCHNEKGLAKNKTLGKHSHPVNIDVKRLGIGIDQGQWHYLTDDLKTRSKQKNSELIPLPLYNTKGLPADHDGRVGCGTCHDPHNWSVKKEIKAEKLDVSKVEGNANNSFLRIPDNGTSNLCVNCHVDKKSVFLTKHDLTDQAIKYDKTSTKDKASENNAQGACLHCHQPHNAGTSALWSMPLGDAKTPVAQQCASCHQKDKIAGKKLPGDHSHPLGISIGKLKKDKELPLFNSEGNKSADADLVDCASCHNPHQWDPADVKNRSLPVLGEEGDASNSFLRVTANSNSELCIRCHAEKKTIVGTDHDFDEKSANALNQKRDVSGLCGQCHVPHKAEADSYLWAQPLGKGQDVIERRCRSCHAEQKSAENKNPKQGQHPKQIKIWSTELRKAFYKDINIPDTPVYDEQGRKTKFGSITCASCHNPHQWQAFHKETAVKNNEGDVMTSFLRNSNSENVVCADCHDNDGLYRYKYFHSDITHKPEPPLSWDEQKKGLPFYRD